MVDLFKPNDFIQQEQWGETDVVALGKQNSSKIDEFYAQIDVLIVPSIWPESFGLVSREAALRGVWVIAADAGGLAEDIAEAETGFIFPMGDAQECLNILTDMNQSWEKFKNSSPQLELSTERIVSQEVHIDQLATLYRQ